MSTANAESEHTQAKQVVGFWTEAGPDQWFRKDDAFDEEFRSRFMDLHFCAARRELEDWSNEPNSSLALIILLDQFPRNAFRGTAHMFATDPLARFYAGKVYDAGFIEQVDPPLRLFMFLPFTHAENVADQELSLRLYREYAPESLSFGVEHLDIIKRFGRFPHRNAVLGRETTAEEQAFLDEGGFAG